MKLGPTGEDLWGQIRAVLGLVSRSFVLHLYGESPGWRLAALTDENENEKENEDENEIEI